MAAGNIVQNTVFLDIVDRLKSQGGFKRTIERMDDLGKSLTRSEKEAARNQLMMEKAGMAAEKAINREINVRKKQEASMSNMQKRSQRFNQIYNEFGLNQAQARKAMSAGGIQMQKNGDITDLAGAKLEDYSSQMRRGASESGRFNMNALGVMFAGMAMNRVFKNLNATSREWVGMNELMSTMMGVVTLPATMELLELGVLPLFDALTNLPEGAKLAIGTVITALEGLGGVMMVGGQMMLGLESTANLLSRIGGGAGAMAGLSKISSKLGSIAKYAATGILVAIAIKDLSEGEVLASIGMGLAAAGIIVGGPGGIAMMSVGVTLKLLGDEDFLVSVLKTMYKIGSAINSIVKEAVLSAFTMRDFNVDNIQGISNVGRAFKRAIEEIQQEEAGNGIFDVIVYPEGMLDAVQEDINKLEEELKNDIINREEYIAKLEPLVDEQEKILKRWQLAYAKNEDAKSKVKEQYKELELSGFGKFVTSPAKTIASFSPLDSFKKLIGIKAVGGKVRENGNYYLHQGEEVVSKSNVSSSNAPIIVTYNVTVSDKREFEQMLRANNNQLTSDIRRMTNT